jgi:uncharacterized protein
VPAPDPARCRRGAWRLDSPVLEDLELEVVRSRGGEHEAQVLEGLRAAGKHVVEIEFERPGLAAYREAQQRTLTAMREGADAIYQAVLFDGRWLAYADFLEKVERPSALGSWSYEVADTKLARRPKASALIQIGIYTGLLAGLQQQEPVWMHLVLGTGARESFRVVESAAYVRAAKRRLEEAVAAYPWESYPEPVDHCGICRWREICARGGRPTTT